ncbi:hypothetical protein [Dechloromonas denitrificans]|uniref:hypothetical protein n=1 Tax=Dechloromonas denitrificans TaxID=281362 RepID=UPI001CFB61D7|nr:hypothetical protein [Dechloromonas denitrificans]UCV06466.1 hypothetical protein KI615_13690 [Dechloromonas denitrificans]
MASVIQSLSSGSTGSQIVSLETVTQPASQLETQPTPTSTVVVLGSTTVNPSIYNAAGVLITTGSSVNVAIDTSTTSSTNATTTVTGTNTLSSAPTAALEAKQITDSSAVLAAPLVTQLASQAASLSAERTTTNTALAASQIADNLAELATTLATQVANNAASLSVDRATTNIAREANRIADNSTVLAATLATQLASQTASIRAERTTTASLAADARLASTDNNNTSRSVALAQPASTTESSQTLNQLLSDGIRLTGSESVATGSPNSLSSSNSATTNLPIAQLSGAAVTESIMAKGSIPATTASPLVAGNTTVTPGNSSEVANLPVSNPVTDSRSQAIVTVAQNPAYANLIAGYYKGIATSSAQSPSVAIIPIRAEEIKPPIAILPIDSQAQLGGQSGRDGNSGLGYRQRRAYFSYRQDKY